MTAKPTTTAASPSTTLAPIISSHHRPISDVNGLEVGALYAIGAAGLGANVLMIACVLCQRRLRKMTSAFILHACIVNIALTVYCLLKAMGKEALCNSLGTSYIVLMTASIFNLVAIVCCEVYIFGEENIGGEDAGGSACCVIFALSLVYISSIILHLGPTIIGGNFEYDLKQGECPFVYGQSKNYIVYIMWIVIVSMALVGTVYYLIIMYRTIQINTHHRVSSLIRASVAFSGRNNAGKRLDHLLVASLNRARVLTGVTALHCLCWYPLFLLTIVDPRFKVDSAVYKAFTLLAWSNAAVEPMIFLVFDKQVNFCLTSWLPCVQKLPTSAQEDRPLVCEALNRPVTLQERIGCRLCYLEAEAGPSHIPGPSEGVSPLDTPGSGILVCPHHVESSHTIATNFVEDV